MSGHTDKIPGVFTFLGIRNKTADSMYALHRPKFTMDEQQLPTGETATVDMVPFSRSHAFLVSTPVPYTCAPCPQDRPNDDMRP